MATAYAEEIGALYLETSAKDDTNVQDIFVKLSYRLPQPQAADSNVIRATSNTGRGSAQNSGNNAAGGGTGCC